MDAKKNPKSDLRRYSGLFLEAGFILAFAVVIYALNYTVSEKSYTDLGDVNWTEPDPIIVPVTRPAVEVAQPPMPKVAQILVIEDDPNFEDEDIDIDVEATPETKVIIVDYATEADDPDDDPIYDFVAKMPSFPGGEKAMAEFISKNVVYPEIARQNGIKGKVYVQFVVNKKGKIEQIKVMRGVDSTIDQQALNVVSKMPDWIPGESGGHPVSVYFTLPINFQLN